MSLLPVQIVVAHLMMLYAWLPLWSKFGPLVQFGPFVQNSPLFGPNLTFGPNFDGLCITGAEIFAFKFVLENHTNFEEKIHLLPAEIHEVSEN